jgi:hypothetical protein
MLGGGQYWRLLLWLLLDGQPAPATPRVRRGGWSRRVTSGLTVSPRGGGRGGLHAGSRTAAAMGRLQRQWFLPYPYSPPSGGGGWKGGGWLIVGCCKGRALQERSFPDESWVGTEESWVGSDKSWVGTDESWVGTDESWVGTDESWVGTDESWVGTDQGCYTLVRYSILR